jgi:hypothetical protein
MMVQCCSQRRLRLDAGRGGGFLAGCSLCEVPRLRQSFVDAATGKPGTRPETIGEEMRRRRGL